MLLRASNAVGYKNYPDNVIKEFVEKSAHAGIDVFRIFDSLNWIEGMTTAIDAVRASGKIAEAAVCYTGDILDSSRTKYNTDYYITIAKELEARGAHILGIKDMAGLLKPQAAYELVSRLKETVDLPIHLHTHDTSGNGIYTYAKAIEAGVDTVDVATSNLQQQAKAVGLAERWDDVKKVYRRVNEMFGDVVKVTPSSKVVGDMALFMVQNNLTEDDVYEKGATLDFPDSVVELFQGYLGQPYQGFPKKLQELILKGREPITVRPGEFLEAVDFTEMKETLSHKLDREVTDFDTISYSLYPKVYLDYEKIYNQLGDISVLDTPTFFYGMSLGEEIEVEIEQGKTLIVKLVSIGEPQNNGTRVIYFELNGQPREVIVRDDNIKSTVAIREKANKNNPNHIGASMPGTVFKIIAEKGKQEICC